MKVLILGIDGYIGYSLALHLLKKGHKILGVDNLSRRWRVSDLGSDSLTPIGSHLQRLKHFHTFPGFIDEFNFNLGIDPPQNIASVIDYFKPEAIIHLAEQPSAAWSMISARSAAETQLENVIGTLHLLWAIKESNRSIHLIKLGTMGEYGTPKCNIPEGRIPKTCKGEVAVEKHYAEGEMSCPMSGLLFPRTAGSFYHLSKVHDTHNIEFACRNWGLRSTDIMQGVVFGLNDYTDEIEMTRFDYDECFGTVINRFCAQAIIGHSLTVYGKGNQTRGFLPLKDSLQCLTLVLEQPPQDGEYRTLNQFENTYSVNQLAEIVQDEWEASAGIEHIYNPRLEAESHYYNPSHDKLFKMGYVPTTNIQSEIAILLNQIYPYRSMVNKKVLLPKTDWR